MSSNLTPRPSGVCGETSLPGLGDDEIGKRLLLQQHGVMVHSLINLSVPSPDRCVIAQAGNH